MNTVHYSPPCYNPNFGNYTGWKILQRSYDNFWAIFPGVLFTFFATLQIHPLFSTHRKLFNHWLSGENTKQFVSYVKFTGFTSLILIKIHAKLYYRISNFVILPIGHWCFFGQKSSKFAYLNMKICEKTTIKSNS